LKDRRRLETKRVRQAERKKEKALQKEQKKEERLKEKETLTPEELEEKKKLRLEFIADRRSKQEERQRKLKEASESSTICVIDLEFGDLMTESERKSLAHQLMYCYSSNLKSEKPCRILLSGLDGSIAQSVHALSGFDNWPVGKEKGSYLDALSGRKEDLVYLSADSENVVREFDPSKVYIIGGLVDRNRHKGVCQRKAEGQGIATARLPIQDHVKLQTSAVLTVNQVFDIFLKFRESKDWGKTLKSVIPSRKLSSK